jgi:hypothetical protein
MERGPPTIVQVSSIPSLISGKIRVHATFSREEALPHFGKNSEASPGPSEKLPLAKRIYDPGHWNIGRMAKHNHYS